MAVHPVSRVGHPVPPVPGASPSTTTKSRPPRAADRGGAAVANGRGTGSAELLRLMSTTRVPRGKPSYLRNALACTLRRATATARCEPSQFWPR